ncbi:MAG: phosphonate C-P lyase system protein PhnH, partial [Desulfobacterales bacterium]
VLLAALSHPGRLYPVEVPDSEGLPGDLLLSVAATLLDHEVTFALTQPLRASLANAIRRCSGAAQTVPERADFIFVEGASSNNQIAAAKRGTSLYPDDGATAVYQVPASHTSDPQSARATGVTLSGPGIPAPSNPLSLPLDIEELILLSTINADYPMGVDAFILQGNRAVMGLPRSTRITVD